jgi:hypothetical protein
MSNKGIVSRIIKELFHKTTMKATIVQFKK